MLSPFYINDTNWSPYVWSQSYSIFYLLFWMSQIGSKIYWVACKRCLKNGAQQIFYHSEPGAH